MKESPLKRYLDETEETVPQFALRSRVPFQTAYKVVKCMVRPSWATTKKIVRASNKKLTMEDFGFDSKTRKRIKED